jgi:hypothetical protein
MSAVVSMPRHLEQQRPSTTAANSKPLAPLPISARPFTAPGAPSIASRSNRPATSATVNGQQVFWTGKVTLEAKLMSLRLDEAKRQDFMLMVATRARTQSACKQRPPSQNGSVLRSASAPAFWLTQQPAEAGRAISSGGINGRDARQQMMRAAAKAYRAHEAQTRARREAMEQQHTNELIAKRERYEARLRARKQRVDNIARSRTWLAAFALIAAQKHLAAALAKAHLRRRANKAAGNRVHIV